MPSHSHGPAEGYFHVYGAGGPDGVISGGVFKSIASTDSTGGNGSHFHTIGGSSSTTGSTGSGTSFSIVNPYKAVYIWTRTA